MVRLQKQLEYFVCKKISEDPLWQKTQVVLSGHQVLLLFTILYFGPIDFITFCLRSPARVNIRSWNLSASSVVSLIIIRILDTAFTD